MSTNLYSKLEYNHSYKLVQLAPDLLKTIKESKSTRSPLQFKSLNEDTSDVVICSDSKTWLVKQKNHSNTVLLMKEFIPEEEPSVEDVPSFGLPLPNKSLVTFAKTEFEFETRDVEGQLNLDLLSVYNGEIDFPQYPDKMKIKTFQNLLDNSPCSKLECENKWHELGGSIVNGYVCILSQAFMSKALNITLTSLMGESLNLEKLDLEESFMAVHKDTDGDFNPYTKSVVETILNKFGYYERESNTWKLNMATIAKWYGIEALKKYVGRISMPVDEFFIKWKAMFPPYFPCDLDIDMLRGYHYKPSGTNIQYISKDIMSTDPKERFKDLFKLQSQWDLDDIAPFVVDLNTKGLKIDNFIMKYARRRKIPGKKTIIITSR